MVDRLIEIASGALLRFSLLVMILGLGRLLVLQFVELSLARRRAGDPHVAWPLVRRRLLEWSVPAKAVRRRDRLAYNAASIAFHLGILIVPVFFAGHVALWTRTLGIALPALPQPVSVALSLVMAAALVALLVARARPGVPRSLTRAQDWAFLTLLLAVVLTGLGAAYPMWSPVPARTLYLAHLIAGESTLVLVPFSKLQHVLLFWTSGVSTELGWRFSPGVGDRVRLRLGREGQRV